MLAKRFNEQRILISILENHFVNVKIITERKKKFESSSLLHFTRWHWVYVCECMRDWIRHYYNSLWLLQLVCAICFPFSYWESFFLLFELMRSVRNVCICIVFANRTTRTKTTKMKCMIHRIRILFRSFYDQLSK